jgi:hypothetical protein
MSILDDNMIVFSQRYPALTAPLLAIQTTEQSMTIRIAQAKSGMPTMMIDGYAVHSTRDPVHEGQRIAATLKKHETVLVLGLGLAYAAEAAIADSPERPLIIVERHLSLLRLALETRDLRRLFSARTVILVLSEQSDAVYWALQYLDQSAFGRSVQYLKNRVIIAHDAQWYAEVERHIQTWAAKDAVNRATLERFGMRWTRNLARNISLTRDVPGVRYLTNALAGTVPVVLVAAGPSLDTIAPFLPALAERSVIVAVDTALRFLIPRGVEPDFTVVVDPQYWNARHLDRLSPGQTCLISESAVYPAVLRQAFKRIFIRSSLFPLGRFIEDRVDTKGTLASGGSVATTAWDFARHIGAQSVWIAGLDLSFPALKTHFKGALFEERALAESYRLNPVASWHARLLHEGQPVRASAADGSAVLTDTRLSLYAAWFENQLRRYPHLRTYRFSPQGIFIPGMTNATVEEALSLPVCRSTIRLLLRSAFEAADADFNTPEQRKSRDLRYHEALHDLLDGLTRLQTQAQRADAALELFYRKRCPTDSDRTRLLAVLDGANRLIRESTVKEVAGFLFPPLPDTDPSAPDPFAAYLESCRHLYGPLADTAGSHYQILRGQVVEAG